MIRIYPIQESPDTFKGDSRWDFKTDKAYLIRYKPTGQEIYIRNPKGYHFLKNCGPLEINMLYSIERSWNMFIIFELTGEEYEAYLIMKELIS